MHIPDGLMDPAIWIAGWLIALAVVGIATLRVGKGLDEKKVPLMAVLAAGIFIAQMLNFPIGQGVSGHLIGAALATLLVGPWASIIIITVILIIQALVFGDGGITAMGLNILNMAVIASLVTWGVVTIAGPKYRRTGVPAAAWASVFIASTVCAAQLAASFALSGGTFGIDGVVAFPTMMGFHVLIAIGEAVITGGVVLYLSKVAPEMLWVRKAAAERAAAREA